MAVPERLARLQRNRGLLSGGSVSILLGAVLTGCGSDSDARYPDHDGTPDVIAIASDAGCPDTGLGKAIAGHLDDVSYKNSSASCVIEKSADSHVIIKIAAFTSDSDRDKYVQSDVLTPHTARLTGQHFFLDARYLQQTAPDPSPEQIAKSIGAKITENTAT